MSESFSEEEPNAVRVWGRVRDSGCIVQSVSASTSASAFLVRDSDSDSPSDSLLQNEACGGGTDATAICRNSARRIGIDAAIMVMLLSAVPRMESHIPSTKKHS